MSVAPVVSWLMYDSIYTERYMRTPQLNPNGYINASITNVTGFNNVNFLLAHGSGDDNGKTCLNSLCHLIISLILDCF